MHAMTLYAVEHDCGCTFGTRKSTYLQENNNGEERRNSVSNIVPIDLMTITQERTPEKIEEKEEDENRDYHDTRLSTFCTHRIIYKGRIMTHQQCPLHT